MQAVVPRLIDANQRAPDRPKARFYLRESLAGIVKLSADLRLRNECDQQRSDYAVEHLKMITSGPHLKDWRFKLCGEYRCALLRTLMINPWFTLSFKAFQLGLEACSSRLRQFEKRKALAR